MSKNNYDEKKLPEYASILDDAGFKAVLGDERNKELLRQLINLILPKDRYVVEIEHFENRETDGFTPVTRGLRVDVRVKDIHGRTFIVEMQQKMHESFVERCIWYGAKAYGYDLPKGSTYEDLKPVYVIAFLKEKIQHEDESLWNEDHFISCYQMREKSTGEFAPDAIFCIFVELGRFHKDESLLKSTLDKTCYLFRNSGKWKGSVPKAVSDDEFTKQMADACLVANFPPDVKLNYVKEMFTEMDYKAEVKAYYKEGIRDGIKEGIEKGIEKGIKKGIKKGREEGLQEGKTQERHHVAKNMLSAGIPADTVASCTGLTLEELKTLI